MRKYAYTCDVCGAEKRQVNHWFTATFGNGQVTIAEWSFVPADHAELHLCGQQCVSKVMDKYLSGQKWKEPQEGL